MTAQTWRRARQSNMSARERETLLMLAGDFGSEGVADALGVTTHYVYDLVRLLKARLGAHTIAGMVVQALREGLIDLADIPTRPEKKAKSDAHSAD
jgi:DNA-binding CsgD family transcriptional regulator